MIPLHYYFAQSLCAHSQVIGAPVAEWLTSLTLNPQAVTNVGSKPICVILATCPDITLAFERDVNQQLVLC